nr:sigma-70 family RNA polymerase sigma factor [Sphingomicrobium sp. B8]
MDDWLVTATLDGDRKAARQLVEAHHRPMMAHALRLTGNHADAEDAVQGAWREIFARLDRLKDPRAFRAWAYRIVTGKAGRMMRREMADRRRDEKLPEPDAPRAPDTAAEHGELREAIAALPPGQRAAIALFYLEGFSVAEVAAALDIPVGTAKTRLMHARQKLREQFEGENT